MTDTWYRVYSDRLGESCPSSVSLISEQLCVTRGTEVNSEYLKLGFFYGFMGFDCWDCYLDDYCDIEGIKIRYNLGYIDFYISTGATINPGTIYWSEGGFFVATDDLTWAEPDDYSKSYIFKLVDGGSLEPPMESVATLSLDSTQMDERVFDCETEDTLSSKEKEELWTDWW